MDKEKTTTIAIAILKQAEILAEQASKLDIEFKTKLKPIILPSSLSLSPSLKKELILSKQNEYPPLFNDLRNIFTRIESSLIRIRFTLNQTQL